MNAVVFSENSGGEIVVPSPISMTLCDWIKIGKNTEEKTALTDMETNQSLDKLMNKVHSGNEPQNIENIFDYQVNTSNREWQECVGAWLAKLPYEEIKDR